MKKLLGAVSALALIGAAAPALAGSGNPASDTAQASATVVAPLTVTKVDDLVFGKVVQPTSGSGTATIAALSGATASLTGLTAPSGQTTNPAKFTITGDATTTWTASVSTLSTLSDGASHTIPIVLSNSTLTGSPATVYVGGQITVASTDTPATYTGSITVSANYN
jgi:hypothetical protein